jgi:hypothetical protein
LSYYIDLTSLIKLNDNVILSFVEEFFLTQCGVLAVKITKSPGCPGYCILSKLVGTSSGLL